jgi:hypothetical protein
MSLPHTRLDDRDDTWADAEELAAEEWADRHAAEPAAFVDAPARYTPPHLRAPIAHLAHAIRPFVSSAERGPTSTALEVARNVAQVAQDAGEDVAHALAEALLHRMRHQWIAVGDLDAAVTCGAAAWRRASAPSERRAA